MGKRLKEPTPAMEIETLNPFDFLTVDNDERGYTVIQTPNTTIRLTAQTAGWLAAALKKKAGERAKGENQP